MQTPNRSIFLHPPDPRRETDISPRTTAMLDMLENLLESEFPPKMKARTRSELLLREATSSARIENEYRAPQIANHHRALIRYMKDPIDWISMLRAHRTMMRGQPHAQPGRYRTIEVIVGRFRPPDYQIVPSLMERLFAYAGERNHNRTVQAAWAHIQFETIHPFADGNGRTGRALINRILGVPIPISEYILEKRQEYYRLLDSGNWDEYLRWFTQGVVQKAIDLQNHRVEEIVKQAFKQK